MTNQTETLHRNAQGHLVPESLIKTIDLLRDGVVRQQVAAAQVLQLQMAAAKVQMQRELEDYLDLSAQEYGVTYGGAKGNITLTSYDGAYKLQIATAENVTFDERLQAAKTLIDECINEWAKGSRPEIMVLVQQAFQTDKEGNLNVGRILALRRLEIADERWKAAMTAIGESVQVIGTKQYVRLYERVGDSGRYVPIALDMVAV